MSDKFDISHVSLSDTVFDGHRSNAGSANENVSKFQNQMKHYGDLMQIFLTLYRYELQKYD